MDMNQDDFSHDACEGCALGASRREFLRTGLAAALATLATLGARSAAALPINWVNALGVNGSTVSYPLPAADGVQIDKDHECILVRWQNEVYAFSLSCPHQHTALHWMEADARFQCPKHKSKYQPDGSFISGRATRAMDRFTLHQDGGNIVVDLAELHKQDKDPAGWHAAAIKLS
jgi:Rieske Fe-S protein